MWIVLIIFILFMCFILPDVILPMLGIIIGGGILLFVINIIIEEFKDKKRREKNLYLKKDAIITRAKARIIGMIRRQS